MTIKILSITLILTNEMKKCNDKSIDPITFLGKGFWLPVGRFPPAVDDELGRIEAGLRYCEFSITTALGEDLLVLLSSLKVSGVLKTEGLGDPGLFIFSFKTMYICILDLYTLDKPQILDQSKSTIFRFNQSGRLFQVFHELNGFEDDFDFLFFKIFKVTKRTKKQSNRNKTRSIPNNLNPF